jgi:uncharacterized protein YjbI with pentapeptide repeats
LVLSFFLNLYFPENPALYPSNVMGKKINNNQTALHEVSKNDLKNILTNHSLWISSGETKGEPANLAGYNLRGVVLLGENLKKANLQGAYLYGAYLKNANLEQANLSDANLRGANLRWVNLQGANLSGSNLVRADLHESNLKETNLIGTNLQMSDGLTQKQIDQAQTNETTKLPDSLE